MKLSALSLACLVALGACSKKSNEPRIELTDVGFALHLPAAMQQALDSAAPGFRAIRAGSFRADVSQAAAAGSGALPTLFATVGDFNHDGTKDAAVEGTVSGDSALQVVAILNGAKPEAVQVARFPVYDADAVGIYLAPGRAGQDEAFDVIAYPDSSLAFRYTSGGFEGTKFGN